MATQKPQKQQAFDKNTVESFKDSGISIVKGVEESLKKDLAQNMVSDLWKQLLKGSDSGEKQEQAGSHNEKNGEEVEIFNAEKKEVRIEAAIDYRSEILHASEKGNRKESQQLSYKVSEILVELKKLSKSSKQLEVAFKDVSVENTPQNPGKYHLNFFEWVLSVIKNARIRVAESASWMSVVSGKKEKKGYWNNAKKHGTSYTLSSERVVAQQVG